MVEVLFLLFLFSFTSSYSRNCDLKFGCFDDDNSQEMPFLIKSKQSLVYKYMTTSIWEDLSPIQTVYGSSLLQCIRNSIELDNQKLGLYAQDEECFYDFSELFDPIIHDYHNLHQFMEEGNTDLEFLHPESDFDHENIEGNIDPKIPIISTRIRVGRNIEGYKLSPGISKRHRYEIEDLMKQVFKNLKGDLSGKYYSLSSMDEDFRKELVKDHLLFESGDRNFIVGGLERDWPEGRGIFINHNKKFIVWVNEEDQLRIITLTKGGDIVELAKLFFHGMEVIEDSLNKMNKYFQFHDNYGYINSCPSNLGTGMRASILIEVNKDMFLGDIGYDSNVKEYLEERCEELGLQVRGLNGEISSDDEGKNIFDISNKFRLGYTEVELIQMVIDGTNDLFS